MMKTSTRLRALLMCAFGTIMAPSLNAQPAPDIAANDAGFAAALYRQLGAKPGNLLFSPYSLRAALAMAYRGARAKTASQMATLLDFPTGPSAPVGESFTTLDRSLTSEKEGNTLSVANALWGNAGFPFDDIFRNSLVNQYNADLHQVDFATAPEPARVAINSWVSEHTAGKIINLFPPRSITNNTLLVLANAVYFKGAWNDPFRKAATQDAPFYLDASHDVPAATMHAQQRLSYTDTDNLQAVELPYRGGNLSMLLLVPTAVNGLPAIERQLDAAHLKQWTDALQPRTVRLALPKLKLNGKFSLNDALAAMGMPDAFDRHTADFTGMIARGHAHGPLFIGQVFHKALATVDEEGTEAAAATGIGMVTGSVMRRDTDIVTVAADRPFIMLIRHRASGAILFMGRVSDPR